MIKDHPFSTYANFSEKRKNISKPLIRKRSRAYHEVKNVSFSENVACVLNGWYLSKHDNSSFRYYILEHGSYQFYTSTWH